MEPEALASKLEISGKTLRGWLRKRFPRGDSQWGSRWSLTPEQVAAAYKHFRPVAGVSPPAAPVAPLPASQPPLRTGRDASDEGYVIDLCDLVLGEKGSRQHTFDWLVGDPSQNGACRRLPVDAYYEARRLVIEYRERQHTESVPFFDRRETISGVGRGEQRRIYDNRRETLIPQRGLVLVVIMPRHLDSDRAGRLRRNQQHDLPVIKGLLGNR